MSIGGALGDGEMLGRGANRLYLGWMDRWWFYSCGLVGVFLVVDGGCIYAGESWVDLGWWIVAVFMLGGSWLYLCWVDRGCIYAVWIVAVLTLV